MDEFHHMSLIRIGNRLVYNGVNGDAFSFGEKPTTSANIGTNRKAHSTSDLTSDLPNGATDMSINSSKLFSNSASHRDVSENSSVIEEIEQQCMKKPTLAALAETAKLKQATTEALRLQIEPHAEINVPPSICLSHLHLPPVAFGLPPILPPPPAAHLPPPLPSRPPSALPSPASSVSSLLSLKNDERSLPTPPASPTHPSEIQPTNEDNTGDNPNYIRNLFFRSSGTIKVEAPSRDIHHPAPQVPLSPPPLPLPTTSSYLTVPTASKTFNTDTSSEDNHSMKANLSAACVLSMNKTSLNSAQIDSDDDDEDNVDGYDDQADHCGSGGELVVARDGNTIFSKTAKPIRQNSDVNRNIIPPEFDSIRKQSVTYADVISSVLMFYKLNKRSKKKLPYVKPKLEKAPQCRKCGREFGFRCSRYHCSRCKKSFCDQCTPFIRVETDDMEHNSSSLTRVCDLCSEEIAYETSRGAYRGLWSEFKKIREEARAHRGLDVTSSTINKSLESQSLQDVTPGLTSLCLKFLVEVHRQLEKQLRHKFLANYLHFENPSSTRSKSKIIKHKECQACNRQLRMLTDIRDCDLCEQTFCMNCTYKTLQLYLPTGIDLRGDIHIERIKFHVKDNEQDEALPAEASETYRLCADCEDDIMRNIRIYEFNQKIPDIEAEMFDLQRQIDHALTYGPHFHGMQRSVSANNLYHMNEHDSMATNIKLANQLYARYMRAYDNLDHMQPQTLGQKALHKHIKQAMYDFYLKRRNQLKSTLRRRDSWATDSSEVP